MIMTNTSNNRRISVNNITLQYTDKETYVGYIRRKTTKFWQENNDQEIEDTKDIERIWNKYCLSLKEIVTYTILKQKSNVFKFFSVYLFVRAIRYSWTAILIFSLEDKVVEQHIGYFSCQVYRRSGFTR